MIVHRIDRDVSILADQLEVPGIGFLPVNAFVIHADEPVVVDTGLSLADRGFLAALSSVLDPSDVEWIWLTHPDADHTGALLDLLDAAPRSRVVTTFLGVGIMATHRPLPLERVYLLNPGQTLDVGDRQLTALRPPLFDSPATIGCYDHRSEAYFSSDCFGAPMPTAEAATADAIDLPADELHARQTLWATVDSPWVHTVDHRRYLETVTPLHALEPQRIYSTHLPPATGRIDECLAMLATVPDAEPFTGPDQATLEAMLSGASRRVLPDSVT